MKNILSSATGQKVGTQKKSTVLITLIAIVAVLVFGALLVVATKITATEDYYILKDNALPKQTVTPALVEKVSVKKGTRPPTALTLEELQTGKMQARYPLPKGEVVTAVNTGVADTLMDYLIRKKLDEMKANKVDEKDYDNWVLTSFTVPADNAVGGRIKRGDYFDMLVVTDKGAFYPFKNLKTVDTTTSLSGASSANAADSAEAHSGQTSQYWVKLTPEVAARLQWYIKTFGGSIQLVLNSKSDSRIDEDGKIVKQQPVADVKNPYNAYNPADDVDHETLSPGLKESSESESKSSSKSSSSSNSGIGNLDELVESSRSDSSKQGSAKATGTTGESATGAGAGAAKDSGNGGAEDSATKPTTAALPSAR